MPTFPTFQTGKVDSRNGFEIEAEDPTMRADIEGGYEFTRKRHTRTPRRTWTVPYKNLNPADKAALDAHWNQCAGSLIFDWTNPQDNVTYQVRFTAKLKYTYVGRGTTQRWDCSITLRQA